MSKNSVGSIMLLLAALIWGSSFVVMKNAVDSITPNVLLSIRFLLGTLFMILFFFKEIFKIKKKDLVGGILAGIALYLAYTVQTIGLQYTTPGKNAFLTAIYCAIVPFLIWLFYREKPDLYNFIAALLCFIGIGFVSIDSNLNINIGDILTIIGGFMYAWHIIIVKKYSEHTSAIKLTTIQFFVAGCLALLNSILFEDIHIVSSINSSIYFQIIYLALFATTIALLFQNIGQSLVSECRASILLSLESVFGVIFSIIFSAEIININILIGFILIFVAVIVSQTKLSFLIRES